MLSRRLFAAGAAGAPAILAGAARAEDQLAESTIDRIKRGKVLRIAALPGEAPYFNKDIASGAWSGMWFAGPSLAETCTLYSLPVYRRTHCQFNLR